jgi:hypothetical protein
MRKTVSILTVAVVLIGMAVFAAAAAPDSEQVREYSIKAAFIYNFIKFVDWPSDADQQSEEADDDTEPITIGIIGENPFGKAFEAVVKKKVKDKKLVIKELACFKEDIEAENEDAYEHEKALQSCHVLFVCPLERKCREEIIKKVKANCVLTIGETDGFLETGGIIEFVMHENKVQFEINLVAAQEAGLKIRSQLLRLAKRVIKADEEEK